MPSATDLMTFNVSDIEGRVFDGAAFLDMNGPANWDTPERVDLTTLDICDSGKCLLAQLYSSYNSGKLELDLDDYACIELGFAHHHSDADGMCELLTAAWKRTINTRRMLATDS